MVAKVDVCPCCERKTKLTFHHLIPRQMHRRKFFRKQFDKVHLNSGVMICRQCHDGIHRFYSPMVLAKELNTLDKLKQDPQLATYFNWVSKQRIALA